MRKIASLLSVLVLCCTLALGQGRTVTGTVRDANGNPVPFATVTVAGTNTATQADANGAFTLNNVTDNAQLAISSAGFATQTVAASGNLSTITLQRGEGQLSEVVVTALGIRRTRNQVPYAAQQISGADVAQTRTSNFAQNLSGRVSGLEIRQANTLGGSTNVVLRGVKTISSSNQALFVIDGVPVDNTNTKSIDPTTGVSQQSTGRGGYDYGSAISDLNPDDIESITVLKGAASTALYGSRGGNGVILITTKKSARGLGITVNSSIGIGNYDKATFPKYQKEYGGGYGNYYGPNGDAFMDSADVNGDGVLDPVVPFYEDASYGARFDPNAQVYQWDSFDPSSPNFGKPHTWLPAANTPETFFETAVSSNQSILVNGGTDKGSFKLGYTRTDDKGIMPNSKISKNMFNFGGTYNLSNKLTAAANVQFTNINGKGRYGTGYDDKNLMTNFRQWWENNVDIADQKRAYNFEKKNVTWNWTSYDNLTPIYWDNPYFSRYENYETDTRNRIVGYASLNYKPAEWLNIMGRVSNDAYDELQEERQAVGSVTTSQYIRRNRTFRETNYDLLANFDRDISTDLNFKALIGTNVRDSRIQHMLASTNGGLIIERIYSLANSKNPITAPLESDDRLQVWGNFAGATFSWRDMLTVDGNFRVDASSTLPKGNNSYAYWSTSAGFVFSKLLPSATWLNYGKLRANYATVGNATQPYQTADVYTIGSPFGSAPLVSVTGTAANPELLPENTKSYEFGVEAALFRSRAGFDITFYNAKTFNQIFAVPVSTSTGYNSKFLNAGNIRNKGMELSVYGTPVQTKDFSWNINVNFTRNRNKVEELTPGIDNIVLGSFQGGVSLNATLGQPYGTIRGQDFVYDSASGQPIIDQTNGRPLRSSTSNIVIGNVNPDWIGGVNNTLRYRTVSLSFLIDVRHGGDLFSLDQYYGLATGMYPETAGLNDKGNPSRDPISEGGGVILPGVDESGKPNTVRASNETFGLYGYRRQPAAAFVYDASFVKLREMILGYSLPKDLFKSGSVFKGVDLSLIGRNLWIIHKNLPYADPEEIISAGNLQGYQVGAYPTVKTFTFNVRLRF